MTNDCTSAFEAIRIAAQNYVDTPTLIAAGRVQTADLTRAELVMLVAGFAGLTAGVVQTRRAEREAVITAPAPAPTPTDRTPDMSTAAADRPPL